MSVDFRSFKEGDEGIIFQIYSDNMDSFEDIGASPEFILNCSNRADFQFIVAEEEDRIIGFVGVLFFENVGRAELGPIAVSSAHQRGGVGTTLVSSMKAYLKSLGMHRVIVRVKDSNTKAISFFEGLGFEREASLKSYTKTKEDVAQLVSYI